MLSMGEHLDTLAELHRDHHRRRVEAVASQEQARLAATSLAAPASPAAPAFPLPPPRDAD